MNFGIAFVEHILLCYISVHVDFILYMYNFFIVKEYKNTIAPENVKTEFVKFAYCKTKNYL